MTITTLPAAEEIREMRQFLYGGKSPMLGFGSGFQVVFVRHCDDCLAVLAPGRHVVQDELETEALKHLATSGNIPGYLVFWQMTRHRSSACNRFIPWQVPSR